MAKVIFRFDRESNLKDWYVVDDVVMGGRSNGKIYLSESDKGVYEGQVSLENNGGFSSVKYQPKPINVSEYSTIIIKIKGDGKLYQLRVKSDLNDDASYIKHFTTTGDWETIKFEFKDLHPTYRGRDLDLPNYPGETMGEVSFMIANKKEESFRLLLDRIELK